MANLAAILKDEIRRLARKELRTQSGTMKQAVARYRREIAALKRQLAQQEKKLNRLERGGATTTINVGSPADDGLEGVRFSAKSVRSQRKRLGFSAADYGKLVGVSGLTIYNWEHGKARPRKSQLVALAAVRGIGKKEALTRLA